MIPIEIRPLKLDELDEIYQIDRSEEIEWMYRVSDGILESYRCDVVIPNDRSFWESHFDNWKAAILGGAISLGAFDEDTLAGFAILQSHRETTLGQIMALYVSVDYRLSGIAKSLFMDIQDIAKKNGATELCVAATPTHSSVKFYLSQGFTLASDSSLKKFEADPNDIPLSRPL